MNESELRAVVDELNEAWNRAFNDGDASALAARYREDARLSPGNGEVVTGRAQIESLFAGFFANGVSGHALDVISLGEDADTIYQLARWSAAAPEQDGAAQPLGGVVVHVFTRDAAAGEWMLTLHVWN